MSSAGFFREKRSGYLIEGEDSEQIRAVLEELLPEPDRAFETGDVIKPGSRTHVGLVRLAGQTYFLKRYNRLGFVNRLAYCFRRSRAWRTWNVSGEMYCRDLPVPRPLLVVERRRFRFVDACYLLTEVVPDAVRLVELWQNLDADERTSLLATLGANLGQLHSLGFVHGDLKWPNILFAHGDPDSLCFVDLDGSSASSGLTRSRAKKDLDRFVADLEKEGAEQDMVEQFLEAWLGVFDD